MRSIVIHGRASLVDSQKTVGWLARQPNGSFNLKVARVDLSNNRIDLATTVDVATGVDTFDFSVDSSTTPGSDMVVFSRSQSDGSGRKEIIARPISECTDCEVVIKNVNADGGYRVTQYDGLFILMETTLSSMTIKLFNLGTMSQQDIIFRRREHDRVFNFQHLTRLGWLRTPSTWRCSPEMICGN